MYEFLYFNNANQVIREKKMQKPVKEIMDYLDNCLYGTRFKGEIMRQALKEMDWRQNGDTKILEGRRYAYKGFRNRIAIDGSFSSYEYIQDALLRLQIGYDQKRIDMGVVMVTAQRSEKSKLGTTKQLVAQEMEMLHPTINLPIVIVLFDLGKPGEAYEEKNPEKEKAPSKLKDDKFRLTFTARNTSANRNWMRRLSLSHAGENRLFTKRPWSMTRRSLLRRFEYGLLAGNVLKIVSGPEKDCLGAG